MLTVTYYPVLGVRYKLRSVKWRAIRHFLQRETRRKLEPECVPQMFLGLLKGTRLRTGSYAGISFSPYL